MALEAGVLRVTIEYAKGLKDGDLFGKADPYAILKVGSQQFRTKTQKRAGTSPVWNETFSFQIINENSLEILVYDEDTISHDHLGTATVMLAQVRSSKKDMIQAPVIRPKSHKQKGFVSVSLVFEPNSTLQGHAPQQAPPAQYGVPSYSSAPYAAPAVGYPPAASPYSYPAAAPPQHYPPAQSAYSYSQPPQQAHAAQGYPPQGTVSGYPPPAQGYPPQGAPSGYPPHGAPPGYPPQGAPSGHPPPAGHSGYPPQGYGAPPQGYPAAHGPPPPGYPGAGGGYSHGPPPPPPGSTVIVHSQGYGKPPPKKSSAGGMMLAGGAGLLGGLLIGDMLFD